MEPVTSGDQIEQTVLEDKITAVNNQIENEHSEEPHPLDKDQNHDKLLLTRGQDFDLDYTLLGNGLFFTQPSFPRI